MAKPSCEIVFFGVDRRLDLTSPSIHKCVITPAKKRFHVSFSGHLWALKEIENPRSKESGLVSGPRLSLLPSEGDYVVEEPMDVAMKPDFNEIAAYGDYYQDGFRSLRNLYSQLTSLRRATDRAVCRAADVVVFIRPDLMYHDALDLALARAACAAPGTVFLPHWQSHGGLNDRFALCVGTEAAQAYGRRLLVAQQFCARFGALHAERLLSFAIGSAGLRVRRLRARASRTRIDGRIKDEDFSLLGWRLWVRERIGAARRKLRWVGM